MSIIAAAACMGCQTYPSQTLAATPPAAAPDPAFNMDQFQIRADEWVSLHFFAYHAARAAAGKNDGQTVPLLPEDAALLADPEIAAAFAPLAAIYAPVLDTPLIRGGLFNFLIALDEGPAAIDDAEARAAMEAFMPVYRAHFWPRHRAMTEGFVGAMQAELARNGSAMAAAVADELDSEWGTDPYIVYVSPYASWAGAMSGARHVYFSAQDADVARHPLEIMFHETSHNRPIGQNIRPAADAALAAAGIESDRFWHYLLFYATGRAAKRVLGDDYVTYVEATGLRKRADTKLWYDALDAVWDDHDTLQDRANAAAALVAAGQ